MPFGLRVVVGFIGLLGIAFCLTVAWVGVACGLEFAWFGWRGGISCCSLVISGPCVLCLMHLW